MILLDLPLEMVYAILTEAVSVLGVGEAVKLRLVCKLFDGEMQRAVLEHPMFEITHGVISKDVPLMMDLKSTTQLILKKLRSQDAGKRPLCNTINEAMEVLETLVEDFPSKRQSYTENLAIAAARSLDLIDIVECLSPDPKAVAENYSGNPRAFSGALIKSYTTRNRGMNLTNGFNNALVAAISSQDTAAMTSLQEAGADILSDTDAFGHPIEAAAANGLESITREIMMNDATKIDNLRHLALSAAARAGQQHIVTLILEDPVLSPDVRVNLIAPIKHALKNGHETVALLLLHYRNTMRLEDGMRGDYSNNPRTLLEAKKDYTILCNGMRNKRLIFVREAMEHFPNVPKLWLALWTQAIRIGSVIVFEAIITNASSQLVAAVTLEENRTYLKKVLRGIPSNMIDVLSRDGRFKEVLSIAEMQFDSMTPKDHGNLRMVREDAGIE